MALKFFSPRCLTWQIGINLNAGNNTIAYKYDAGDSGNDNLDPITVATTTTTHTAEPTATATPTPTATPRTTPTPAPGSNIAIGKTLTSSSSTQLFVATSMMSV
ncbi:hypothetical protein MHH52_13910 [Paenibacillus sp. FSL K6-0276]|uniref:hypothetical protein n=1 Tax=Paenibacillus sp. FSL K6-0276 TaxID=2921450 RepID=UPI0030EC4F68